MKLFLSVDMEGISGIVDTSYINPDSGMNYARGRQFMTEDANAVIEAALEWGATEIVVADSHNTMNNILWESLHPEAKLLAGSPRDYSMMQGLDQSFDAAFFIGYHTRQGVPGVLSHTMSGVVRNMYINGQVVGEFGFNAVYAGMYGVPVCLVSGDDLIAKEAKQLIPEISTAIVKTAVSRTSALCLSRDEATAELKRQTKRALSRVAQVKPVEFAQPLELSIEFSHAGQAEMAAIVPGARYDAEKGIVSYTPQDQHDLYKTMRAMINLASGAEFF
ncbi:MULTISPECIES: M55 family metallopeptidase [Brevibacillus]|jgi:D-amino peptidase|uniref:M55 family metallopeptidase n=1 Tax=Brevibacillus TaxID=55080 RepID=UPI0004692E60|nr:M55 family metallopeptidase [Brevibacillus borstelensis]MBE5397093.1 M55 family metallopeptidase [Brevibacillus borstelensis]MCC0563430.1 M55 family metallopeptidase [Brevibacillus borstelensis]MCM3471618.1 M55 family metallopeptidase [Brevibacillus borstelensis]MCM3558701.1 M55 family metallopeptidase [Brevibacillus borstelensis]MCM3591188.1 M55 family metallopeptidase [Brevibacillus borstelensis]